MIKTAQTFSPPKKVIDFFGAWTEIEALQHCLIRESAQHGQNEFFHHLDFFHRHPFERDVRNLLDQGTSIEGLRVVDREGWIRAFFWRPLVTIYREEASLIRRPPEGNFIGPLDKKILAITLTEGTRRVLEQEGKPYPHSIPAHPLRQQFEDHLRDQWEAENLRREVRQYWSSEPKARSWRVFPAGI